MAGWSKGGSPNFVVGLILSFVGFADPAGVTELSVKRATQGRRRVSKGFITSSLFLLMPLELWWF
jgi:hypothetical protein